MKTNYLVLFDDTVESYCKTIKAVTKTIDEMVDLYACDGLPEKTIRKDVKVYKVLEVVKCVKYDTKRKATSC